MTRLTGTSYRSALLSEPLGAVPSGAGVLHLTDNQVSRVTYTSTRFYEAIGLRAQQRCFGGIGLYSGCKMCGWPQQKDLVESLGAVPVTIMFL